MNAKHLLNDITFTENGPIDVSQLNRLYQLIGWDTDGFYQRFGFQLFYQEAPARVWKRGTEKKE